jgi:YggT family protein
MILTLIWLVDLLAELYIWIIIAAVVLSWLVGFNVVNPYNPAVRAVQSFCYQATEPLLGRIRRFMPDLGGLDISPIVAVLLVQAADILIARILAGTLLS